MIDGTGIYGFTLHYCFLFALFFGSVLVFLYLLKKGRLDMSEEAKMHVFEDDDD